MEWTSAALTTAPLLAVRGLCKSFGGLRVTDAVDLDVSAGEIHAIIGPNGAGKTTLIAELAGELKPDAGTITLDGVPIDRLATSARTRLGLTRTFQISQLLPSYTVVENVALAVQARRGTRLLSMLPARGDAGSWHEAYEHLRTAGLASRADTPVQALSYGEQKQLELVVALATRPRMLLLDEPMAGLGHGESAAMIARLQALKGHVAILLVEHDLDAVFALADRVSVLVYGRVIASGTADAVRDDPAVREAYLGADDELC